MVVRGKNIRKESSFFSLEKSYESPSASDRCFSEMEKKLSGMKGK